MASYNVEGVNLPRPFKLRRLNHFGFNVEDIDAGIEFYGKHLGFRITDIVRFGDLVEGDLPDFLKDDRAIFMTNSSDHHAFLLAHKSLGAMFAEGGGDPECTLSQITWQVGSLAEVYESFDFFKENGVTIIRSGRDMPGSNWHVYLQDPAGFTLELCYGMEQVGINGTSKSLHYYDRRFEDRQPLPQMGDFDERTVAESRGWTPADGFKVQDVAIEQGEKERFDVGGFLLPRPFKVTDIGPIGVFVKDFDKAMAFYQNVMGLTITETVEYEGHRAAFLRHGREHHCLKVYEFELREKLGLSPHTNTVSAGLRVGSYKQLKDAVDYLKDKGYKFIEQPEELAPGIDYSAYVLDPDGHCIQLYYYMELLGRDGKTQPAENLKMQQPWPDTVEPHEDTYTAQTFMGPLG